MSFISNFTQLTSDQCYDLMCAQDKFYDGVFVTAVTTTGIYCRPSCSARTPKRENTEFFETCLEAEQGGYRPCKRCTPHHREFEVELTEQLCRYMDQQPTMMLTLSQLSSVVNVSASHIHRIFKRVLGITPRQYMDACRVKFFINQLKQGGSVTDAIFSSGYGSSSRVYERVPSQIGMTPAEYQDGGSGQLIDYTIIKTMLGLLLVATTQRGICAIQLGETETMLRSHLHKEFPRATIRLASDTFHTNFVDSISHLGHHHPHPHLSWHVRAVAYKRQILNAIGSSSTL